MNVNAKGGTLLHRKDGLVHIAISTTSNGLTHQVQVGRGASLPYAWDAYPVLGAYQPLEVGDEVRVVQSVARRREHHQRFVAHRQRQQC